VNNIRFVNPSVEGVTTCAFDFSGTGTYGNVLILGGEFESSGTAAFCGASNVADLTVVGLFNGSISSSSVTQFPNGISASTGNGSSAVALSTNAAGRSTLADFYLTTQVGSTLPIGPTALGAYPPNSWAVEGVGGGGIAIGTVSSGQPILFAPSRSLAATISNSFLTLASGVGLATSGGTAVPAGTVAQGTGNLLYSSTLPITGLSISIGGSALAAGACSSWVGSITGVTTSMVPYAAPQTYPGDGFYWKAYVNTTGQVTVKVCAAVAGTPIASVYVVRVIQ
jgi:hypothetical protein